MENKERNTVLECEGFVVLPKNILPLKKCYSSLNLSVSRRALISQFFTNCKMIRNWTFPDTNVKKEAEKRKINGKFPACHPNRLCHASIMSRVSR